MRARTGLLLLLFVACDHRSSEVAQERAPAPSASIAPPGAIAAGSVSAPKRARERFDAVEVNVPAGKSKLHVAWKLPDGTGVNDDAPFAVRWVSSDGLSSPPADLSALGKDVDEGFDVPIELMSGSSGGKLVGDLDMVVCDIATHAVCVPLRRQLEITLNAAKGAALGSVTLPLPAAR